MKAYFEPEMKISAFDRTDIITTSGETSDLQKVVDVSTGNASFVETESYKDVMSKW